MRLDTWYIAIRNWSSGLPLLHFLPCDKNRLLTGVQPLQVCDHRRRGCFNFVSIILVLWIGSKGVWGQTSKCTYGSSYSLSPPEHLYRS
jgi:hypothetical protein